MSIIQTAHHLDADGLQQLEFDYGLRHVYTTPYPGRAYDVAPVAIWNFALRWRTPMVYVCMYVYMCVCVRMYVYMCMYVYVNVCICVIHACIHTYIHASTHTYIHTVGMSVQMCQRGG